MSLFQQIKIWVVPENGFKTIKTGPSLQIHFTGQTHWLLSVKTDKNIPFVMESMRSSEYGLTLATEIQLCQIYDAVEFANNGL